MTSGLPPAIRTSAREELEDVGAVVLLPRRSRHRITSDSSAGSISGASSLRGGGLSFRIRYITVARSPVNGVSPAKHSKRTQPSEYMSVQPSAVCPATCSGLRYAMVPTTSPACVKRDSDEATASPKSVTRTRSPSGRWRATRTFSGLTSRWMTP